MGNLLVPLAFSDILPQTKRYEIAPEGLSRSVRRGKPAQVSSGVDMVTYRQANRPITISTPLQRDAFLLTGFSGQEAISDLFCYQLDLVALNKTPIPFEKLLGQKITVTLRLPTGKLRYFNGICNRISQGQRDEIFTEYQMEIVPQLWLLTRITQSRIFQHVSVPDILKEVLRGIPLQCEIAGTFEPRDYCVQYRETDFQFVSRLMEEEGIYYFFKHTAGNHEMVLANTPQSNPDLPDENKVIYEEVLGGNRPEDRITLWQKRQELRSGRYLLWDHCFELPHKHLEAEGQILSDVKIGAVTHKLQVGGNEKLEVYQYPGEYAQRFDGIDRSGGEQPGELKKIFKDNQRTVTLRMQQEELQSIALSGSSDCRQMASGYKFTLQRHFDADGEYLLTQVRHSAKLMNYRSGGDEFEYRNDFKCIPSALQFLPLRRTPKPVVQGTQTAVVVGPAGEEIFTDRHGRVKVQFHWDRAGKLDPDSSCWVRVATSWAGRQWGTVSLPRIGQEVIVAFQEGDPDQPIVVGSLFNADCVPVYPLPENKTMSGTKSRSTPQGGNDNFNEFRFEDKKGSEQIYLQAEKDIDIRVKNDRKEHVERDRHLIVKRDRLEKAERDTHVKTGRDLLIQSGRDTGLTVDGKMSTAVAGAFSLSAASGAEKFGGAFSLEAGGGATVKGKTAVIEGSSGLTIKCGGSFITLDAGGVYIFGPMVYIKSGGSALDGAAANPIPPAKPKDPEEPITSGPTGKKQDKDEPPTHDPDSEENKNKTHWIEAELVDDAGQPVRGISVEIALPDGSVWTGTTNEKGRVRVDHIDPGNCEISYELDMDAWEPK
jgi:type VI secretion system secreted protein VgrG